MDFYVLGPKIVYPPTLILMCLWTFFYSLFLHLPGKILKFSEYFSVSPSDIGVCGWRDDKVRGVIYRRSVSNRFEGCHNYWSCLTRK